MKDMGFSGDRGVFVYRVRRVASAVVAAAVGAAFLLPGSAQAQSPGCTSVNDGSLNFTARFVASDPRQPETTARTITSSSALSVIAAADGYTDNVSSNLVPGTLPFTAGDRVEFTAVVSEYSGTTGMRIRFRINNSYLGLPTGARVTPDPTSTGTYTGYYNVPSGLQGIGMTLDHLGGAASNNFTNVSVTCIPYIDSSLTLGVSMSHSGTPQQGGTVDYTITPSASGAATGTNLNLTFSLPSGMTYNSGSGSGWVCTSTRCTYSNTIANGASGNPLTLRVNIAANAATSLTPSVTLSGGNAGSSANASDPTTIAVVQTPATVTIAGGDNQAASISTAFATALSVTVRDGSNAVIPNTPVIFTAPASGASGTFSNSSNTITVNTDGSGVASAGIFTANATAGAYALSAAAGSASASFSLTNNVVVSPPTVTGLSPTSGSTAGGTSVVITGTNFTGATAVSFGATAASGYTVDSATQITATAPAGSAGAVDVTVTTSAGTSATSSADQFTYLAVPATPSLTASPPALSNSSSATFQFTLGSGTAECALDGGSFAACTSPVTYTGLADGSHSFQVRATNGGVTGTAVSHSWTVDATAPSAPVVTAPANGSSRLVTQRGVSGTAEIGSTVTVNLDGSSAGTATADGSGNWSVTLGSLTAGAHTVKATSSDTAGNVSVDSSTNSFTAAEVMTATASSPTISANINTAITTVQPVTISGGLAPITYALTGGSLPAGLSFDTNTGQISGTPSATLATTTFTVTATDALSQTAAQTFSLTVANAGQTISFTSTAPGAAVVGGASYTPAATATSGLTVGFTVDASSGSVCTISGGVVSFTGAGTCTINADQPGDSNYSAAPQVQQSFTVAAASQTISFTSTAPSAAVVGGATYTPTATATSSLLVGFTVDASSGSVCTISGGVVSFTGAGTCTINADQAGNSSYSAAPQVQQSFAVGAASQTISFTSTAPSAAVVGGTTYTPAATATSSLLVGFTVDASSSSVCTISGGLVSFTGAGTCTINADQAGNGNYSAAPQVQQSFAVAQGSQTISFTSTAPSAAVVGGTTYTPAATATSSLLVGFTVDASSSSVCTLSGGVVSFVGAGTCTINADQAGNGNYSAAPQVQQSFSVAQGSQTINFAALPDVAITASPVTLSATASSGLTVAFTSSTGSICSVSGTSLTLAAQGLCTIVANQAGDAQWSAAPAVTQSFTVRPPTLTISSGSAGTAQFGVAFGQSYTVTGGTAPYVFALASGTLPAGTSLDAATGIVSGTPTAVGAFTYAIMVTDSSSPAATATASVVSGTVAKGDQTLSFTSSPPATIAVGGSAYTVVATSSAGLTPSYAIDSASAGVCTISGSAVNFTGPGNCIVLATQAGSAEVNAAASINQAIAVIAAPVAADLSGVAIAYASTGTAIDLAASISGGAHTAITIATAPAHGTATVAGDIVTYTPSNGYFGTDSFTYTATGPGGTSAPATVTVTIATPALPSAANVVADVAFDSTGKAITLLPGGVYTSVAVGTAPTKGAVTLSGTTATYVPTAGSFGADSFTYTATGPGGTSAPATVTVTIATPALPSAANVAADVAFDSTGQAITLLPGGAYTSVEVATAPTKGAVTLSGTTATYVPTAGSFGADSFTYTATGPGGTSAPATVTVTIATPALPSAANVAADVVFDSTGQAITLLPGGVYTSVEVATAPTKGAVTLSGTTATYVPTAGSFGADSFTYTATGLGGTSAPATVTVTIATPALPSAANVAADVAFDSTGQAITLLPSGVYTSVEVATAPTKGAVTLNGTTATYVPTAGSFGEDSFTYTATGAGGTSAPATVTVTIAMPPPPAAEPINVDAAGTTVENGSTVGIDLSNLVTGSFTEVEIARPPSNGTLTLRGPTGAAAAAAKRVPGEARAMATQGWTAIYAPRAGFSGKDSFQFVAVGPGGRSMPATVEIIVTGQVPTAQPKTASIGDAQTVSVDLTEGAVGGPFTAATIESITPADAATARIVQGGTAQEPSFRLDVATKAHFGGAVVIRYRLANAFGTSEPADVTITVTARPDPSADPVVRAISDTQAETARRFARTQVSNFMARTQQLHHGGGATNPLGIGVSLRDAIATSRMPDNTEHDAAMSLNDRNRAMIGRGTGNVDEGLTNPALPGRITRDSNRLTGDKGAADAEGDGADADAASGSGERAIGSIALWTGGSIEVGTLDRQSGRAKISLSSGGLSGGADLRIAGWATVGLGGGYGSDVSRIDGQAARVQSKTKVVAAYGSFAPVDGMFFDAMIGRGTLDYDTRRNVDANGTVALGKRDGDMTFGAVSTGIDRRDGGLRWSSYGRMEWLQGTLDAYAETGADRYSLRFDARSIRSLTGVVGGRIEFTRDIGFATMSPRLGAEWLHEFRGAGVQALDYADFTGSAAYRIRNTAWQREQYQFTIGSRLNLYVRWMIDMELGMRGAAGERAGQARVRISKEF